jgi:hypothetical protein
MQVKVPMVLKQQEFVDVPQVEFVEVIVHDPVQTQVQVPPRHSGEDGDVEVPGHKQVKVPMIMKQQKFVAVPQVEFVDRIVHDPVQKQIQVPSIQVPVQKKMHVPMIMKEKKGGDVRPQDEFSHRVMEMIDLLMEGKISEEEYNGFLSRGVQRCRGSSPMSR